MIIIPTQVHDSNLARLTNSIYVGTMKFTVENIQEFTNGFLPDVPDVEKLKMALTSAKVAYRVLDETYAKTLRLVITDDITALDTEGGSTWP